MKYRIFILLFSTSFFFLYSSLYAKGECGDVWNTKRVGPFDYSDPFYRTKKSKPGAVLYDSMIDVVEKHHFTPDVESLRSGQSGSLMTDLDYTLMVFPNHYRALWAMIKYEKRKEQLPQIHDNDFPETAECYIKRAIEFRQDDMTVRQINGNYLFMQKKYKQALEQYKMAESKLSDSGELSYNIGLTYFQLENYELAKTYALKANSENFRLNGLKKKLIKQGKW